MPPIRNPPGPRLVMPTMTTAPTLPSMGSIEVSRLDPPSLGCSSGGGCTVSLPEGTRGGASRGPVMRSRLSRRARLAAAG